MDAETRRDLENDLELMRGRLDAMRVGHRERFPEEPDVLAWIVNGPPDVDSMSLDEMVPLLRCFESRNQMHMMEILIEFVSGLLEQG